MYISNPFLPRVRRLAVNDVLSGRLNQLQAARKYGVVKSTISKWMRRAPVHNVEYIQTRSSRPHTHPNQLSQELVDRVVQLRKQEKRCAPILHQMLKNEGVTISLSSVERVLRRYNLTRNKKQLKPPYGKISRPAIEAPGDMVELDTIHFVKRNYSRFFVYAAIDLYSRMGYAEFQPALSARTSFHVVQHTQSYFTFPISVIQTDNGAEFSEELYFRLQELGITLRHTRVRRPNDNAHVERFIRTIQEECFGSKLPKEKYMQNALDEYISFYNLKRLHLALNCQTPASMVSKVLK